MDIAATHSPTTVAILTVSGSTLEIYGQSVVFENGELCSA
jgi:hypothetical protein